MPQSTPPPDLNGVKAFLDALYGMILAFTGGLVVALNKLAAGEYTSRWGVIADLVASGFAGVMVYTLCRHFEAPFMLSAFLTGMAGHAGVRALAWLEQQIVKRLGEKQ